MKQNLTEMQYVQIAKETLTHALNEVPFVSDIEIENSEEEHLQHQFFTFVFSLS